MKSIKFNRHSLCCLALLLFFTAIIYSCKKTDTVSQLPDSSNYAERFFDKPKTSTPEIDSIINFFKTQNEKNGFLDKLPENAGIPIWDKLIDKKPVTKWNEAARGIIADKDGNYLIPLSNDKATLSAVLFALYQDGRYNFYCYTNDYLYKICYSTHYPVAVREKALALFMYMSNYVFGISEFKGIPKELFETPEYKQDGLNTKFLKIKPVMEPIPDTAYIESLKCVTVCIQIWKFENCTCSEENRNPDRCDWCAVCAPADCFGEWIGTDGSGVSFGDNSGEPPLPPSQPFTGTGGGGTNWIPPTPPCPGLAWYVKVPLTGAEGQGCNPNSSIFDYFAYMASINSWSPLDDLNASLSHDPYSTNFLRNHGESRGWDIGVSNIEFNKRCGKAFENSALEFFELPANCYPENAPDRALKNAANGGTPNKVVPDAHTAGFYWKNEGDYLPPTMNVLGGYICTEVKAVNGPIRLSSNRWQVLGELELLSKAKSELNNPNVPNSVKPVLFFITTSNTTIDQSIINEANTRGIMVWQSKSTYDPSDCCKLSFTLP